MLKLTVMSGSVSLLNVESWPYLCLSFGRPLTEDALFSGTQRKEG